MGDLGPDTQITSRGARAESPTVAEIARLATVRRAETSRPRARLEAAAPELAGTRRAVQLAGGRVLVVLQGDAVLGGKVPIVV